MRVDGTTLTTLPGCFRILISRGVAGSVYLMVLYHMSHPAEEMNCRIYYLEIKFRV